MKTIGYAIMRFGYWLLPAADKRRLDYLCYIGEERALKTAPWNLDVVRK